MLAVPSALAAPTARVVPDSAVVYVEIVGYSIALSAIIVGIVTLVKVQPAIPSVRGKVGYKLWGWGMICQGLYISFMVTGAIVDWEFGQKLVFLVPGIALMATAVTLKFKSQLKEDPRVPDKLDA